MPSNAAAAQPKTDTPPPARLVRRRDSLFVRVVALCVVLVLCLLGIVFALTQYYINESVQEMREHADQIARYISDTLRDNPDITEDALAARIEQSYDYTAEFLHGDDNPAGAMHLELNPSGTLDRVVPLPLSIRGENITMILRATTEAQGEILRAFKNRYLIALVAVFLLTIGLMVYFITRSLRPLQELNTSISAISEGQLQPVSTRRATGEVRALEESFNTMVAALRDKEAMEAKLRQAQRLSALGNLAAGVAHDVRNPLNAIKLLSSHALDTLEGESPAVKPLRTIRDEVKRLEDIVSSFLSLAKEREVVLEPTRIDGMLQDCVRLFQQDAGARDVRLAHELRAGNALLMLDPKQFTRAILNILLNALEASPPGGRVRLFSRITADACEIEIRDDGPGMPREVLDQVFDPYYTTKPGGTGLGLSITRGIVEEHGGTIEISCIEGQGCQVLIRLPLEKTVAR